MLTANVLLIQRRTVAFSTSDARIVLTCAMVRTCSPSQMARRPSVEGLWAGAYQPPSLYDRDRRFVNCTALFGARMKAAYRGLERRPSRLPHRVAGHQLLL